MDINLSLEKIVKEWLENIEDITYFFCSIEPEYIIEPENPEEYIDMSIEDNKGLSADIIIPLKNCGNKINFNISFQANLELYETIRQLLSRFPEKTKLFPQINNIPKQ